MFDTDGSGARRPPPRAENCAPCARATCAGGVRAAWAASAAPRGGEAPRLRARPARAAARREPSQLTRPHARAGDIDRKEFKLAAKALGLNTSKTSLTKMMSEFDEDGGGTIDFPEFRSFICKNELKSLIDKIEESLGTLTEPDLIKALCEKVGSVVASEHFVLYKRQLGEYKCVATHTVEAFVDSPPRITVGDVLPERRYEKIFAQRTEKGERMPAVALKPGEFDHSHAGASSRRSSCRCSRRARMLGFCELHAHVRRERGQARGRGDHPRHVQLRHVGRPLDAAAVHPAGVAVDADHLGLPGFPRIGDSLLKVLQSLEEARPELHFFILIIAGTRQKDGKRWCELSAEVEPVRPPPRRNPPRTLPARPRPPPPAAPPSAGRREDAGAARERPPRRDLRLRGGLEVAREAAPPQAAPFLGDEARADALPLEVDVAAPAPPQPGERQLREGAAVRRKAMGGQLYSDKGGSISRSGQDNLSPGWIARGERTRRRRRAGGRAGRPTTTSPSSRRRSRCARCSSARRRRWTSSRSARGSSRRTSRACPR